MSKESTLSADYWEERCEEVSCDILASRRRSGRGVALDIDAMLKYLDWIKAREKAAERLENKK